MGTLVVRTVMDQKLPLVSGSDGRLLPVGMGQSRSELAGSVTPLPGTRSRRGIHRPAWNRQTHLASALAVPESPLTQVHLIAFLSGHSPQS